MSWLTHHTASEEFASNAHIALRNADELKAKQFFAKAAELEQKALELVDPNVKPRTFSITAVSATALLYKSDQLQQAEKLAHQLLAQGFVQDFAKTQLQELLQSV